MQMQLVISMRIQSQAAKTMQIHADFDPGQTLKGLSHEMDLAFWWHVWLFLGLNRGRGQFLNSSVSCAVNVSPV